MPATGTVEKPKRKPGRPRKTAVKVREHLTPEESDSQAAADRAAEDISIEDLTDVRFYMRKLADISRRVQLTGTERIDPLDATRLQKYWADQYELVTGVALREASRSLRDPIEMLTDNTFLEQNEDEMNKVESAIMAIRGLDVPKKKRWLSLIDRARALQLEAKSSAIAMWTYVGRDTETGDVFRMQTIQKRFFDVWNDDRYPHSLTMAPPGHSKTTCLRGQVIWDIAQDPTLRVLILYDTDDKSGKEITVLKALMRGKYFRALYPHVRVLGRNDDAEDSRRRFTVLRSNTGSREPTVEGAAIMSQINGNGYDRIYVDDPCPAMVAKQPAVRENINFKWNNEIEERLRNPRRSRIRMVCTPWHLEDLAGHIQQQCREGSREGWLIAIDQFRIKNDQDGKPISLWPERFDSKYYAMKRLRLNLTEYTRLYELRCQSEEDQIVHKLVYYATGPFDTPWCESNPEQVEAFVERLANIRKGELWLSIDPSATSGRDASETACSDLVITAGGQGYLTDIKFFPGDPGVMQEWIVQRIANGAKKGVQPIFAVLVEAQGGMKGMVSLWKQYIDRRLRELGVKWSGSLIDIGTGGCRRGLQGRGGGQNIGKRQRLKNVSSYLTNGYLKFPGRLFYNAGFKEMEYRCSKSDAIQKLRGQIIHFPMGTSDGVDTVTQWLIFNESRLVVEGTDKVVEELSEYEDTMKTGMRRAIATLRDPRPKSDSAEEERWLNSRFN